MRTDLIAALASAAAIAALCACAPPPQTGSAIDQDIDAARNVGPVSTAPGEPMIDGRANFLPTDEAPPETPPEPQSVPEVPAGPGNPQIGRDFSIERCTGCHVVSPDQASTLRASSAPDFSSIAHNARMTRLDLNIWLRNPHPTMPTLRLSETEARDVVAYIFSLRKENPR